MNLPPQSKSWMAAIGSILPLFMTVAYLVPIWAGLRIVQQGLIGDERAVISAIFIFGGAALLFFLVTFIHEMGHAIAAWSVGHKVHFICVGSWGMSPAQRKLTRIKNSPDREYAGFVAQSARWGGWTKSGAIWVSAGGAAATAFCAVIIYLASNLSPGVAIGFKLIGLAFLIDAVVNLIPLIWGGRSASDGLHILQYMAGYQPKPDDWAAMRLRYVPDEAPLADDAEWAQISGGASPFLGKGPMRDLISREAKRRGDGAVLRRL